MHYVMVRVVGSEDLSGCEVSDEMMRFLGKLNGVFLAMEHGFRIIF